MSTTTTLGSLKQIARELAEERGEQLSWYCQVAACGHLGEGHTPESALARLIASFYEPDEEPGEASVEPVESVEESAPAAVSKDNGHEPIMPEQPTPRRGGTNRLDPAIVERIYELRDTGITVEQIAVEVGVSKSSVSLYLRRRAALQAEREAEVGASADGFPVSE